MDSIFTRIDAASITIPADLDSSVLIYETYDYPDYLEMHANKFSDPIDTKFMRDSYARYNQFRSKGSMISNPRFKIIYKDLGTYEDLDVMKFRYVLKTTYRLQYNPKKLAYAIEAKRFGPWQASITYYIFDRRDNVVFGAMKNLEQLQKKAQ